MPSYLIRLQRFVHHVFDGKAHRVAISAALYHGLGWVFDNVLYAWALWSLGFFHGWLVMTTAAAAINLACLVGYMRWRTDWLGIEAVQKAALVAEERQYAKRLRQGRFAKFPRVLVAGPLALLTDLAVSFIRRGGVPAFLALSVGQDAFVTTAFFMEGGAISRRSFGWRNWGVFLASLVVSNVYWGLRWEGILQALRWGIDLGHQLVAAF